MTNLSIVFKVKGHCDFLKNNKKGMWQAICVVIFIRDISFRPVVDPFSSLLQRDGVTDRTQNQ